MQYFTVADKPWKKNARKTENKGERNEEKIIEKKKNLEKLALKSSIPLFLTHIIYLKGLDSCSTDTEQQ